MKLSELKKILSQHFDKNIDFILPTGTKIPSHAHVTDIAHIEKKFIDCGETFRTEKFCRLQTWFSDDTEHRIGVRMLFKALEKAAPFLGSEDLEVDVEYEAPFISQFPIASAAVENGILVIRLGIRHTACMAEDRCLPPALNKIPVFKGLPTLQPAKCC